MIYSYNWKSSFVKEKSIVYHWLIIEPAYFIIWFSFNINFRFSINWCSRAQKVIQHKYVKYTCSIWKQYNKMAVLHFLSKFHSNIYSLLFGWKGLKKFILRDCLNPTLIFYSLWVKCMSIAHFSRPAHRKKN